MAMSVPVPKALAGPGPPSRRVGISVVLHPPDRIAGPHRPAHLHTGERPAPPRRLQPRPQARKGLVHAFARARLPADAEARASHLQEAAAGPLEAHAPEQDVGPPHGRVDLIGDLRAEGLEHLGLDQGHLSASSTIGVPPDALAGLHDDLVGRIHGAPPRPLDPEGLDASVSVVAHRPAPVVDRNLRLQGYERYTMNATLILLLVVNSVALIVVWVLYRRARRANRTRRVEAPNSEYTSPYVLDLEARDRWESMELELLHPLNREEVQRILGRLRATNVRALTETERGFLDRMVEAERRARLHRRRGDGGRQGGGPSSPEPAPS